jgi:hypothetical protein
LATSSSSLFCGAGLPALERVEVRPPDGILGLETGFAADPVALVRAANDGRAAPAVPDDAGEVTEARDGAAGLVEGFVVGTLAAPVVAGRAVT